MEPIISSSSDADNEASSTKRQPRRSPDAKIRRRRKLSDRAQRVRHARKVSDRGLKADRVDEWVEEMYSRSLAGELAQPEEEWIPSDPVDGDEWRETLGAIGEWSQFCAMLGVAITVGIFALMILGGDA